MQEWDRRPPAVCQVCGAGRDPRPMWVGDWPERRGNLRNMWEYQPCGHTYGLYAPDEDRARAGVADLQGRKAKQQGGGGSSGRSRKRRKAREGRSQQALYQVLAALPSPQPERPLLEKTCPCGEWFVTRDPRRVYHSRECKERQMKKGQRRRKGQKAE